MIKNWWPCSRFVCHIWQSPSSSALIVLVKLGTAFFNPRLSDPSVVRNFLLPVNSLALPELSMQGVGMMLGC